LFCCVIVAFFEKKYPPNCKLVLLYCCCCGDVFKICPQLADCFVFIFGVFGLFLKFVAPISSLFLYMFAT